MLFRVLVEPGKSGGGEDSLLICKMLENPGKQDIDAGRNVGRWLTVQHRREQHVGVREQRPVLLVDRFVAAGVVRTPNELDEPGDSRLIAGFLGIGRQYVRRETNTMPQWAGSCWYYLRYLDAHNSQEAWNKEKEKYWMPVDLYVGGVEHAVLHLLYARFWHHVLHDLGLVSTREPFKRLVNQGMILGEDNQKMSKSRGNVIIPDDII